MHLSARSSWHDAGDGSHAPARRFCVRSNTRASRGSQSTPSTTSGHVAGRVVRCRTAPGHVSVRGSSGRRVALVHRTPVRSGTVDPPTARLIRLVMGYQRAVEGRPSPCRFSPTCSAYAIEALQEHGTLRGLWLTVRRLVRCRPFGPSGWDPVPLSSSDRSHDRSHHLSHHLSDHLSNDKGFA